MMKKIFSALAVCALLPFASSAWAQTCHVLDTGDPTERICNPKSYTDLGNGIVRDNVTGLEWVQDGNLMATRDPDFDNDGTAGDGAVTWQHALDYIDLLNSEAYLGYGDWRLPTVEELSMLVDAGRYDPAMDPVFSAEGWFGTWSSTARAGQADYCWAVSFSSGTVADNFKGNPACVRAVRGGQLVISSDFVVNGDGTVTDTATGLMWLQCNHGQAWDGEQCTGSASGCLWADAAAYIQGLNDTNYLGYDDWRLPTRNELHSVVDYSLYNPATALPGMAVYDYWSSTGDASSADRWWFVFFSDGLVYNAWEGRNNYVRAVRGGPCRADGDWCIDENDCGEGTYCDADSEQCVECLVAEHCPAGYGCAGGVCNGLPVPGAGPFVAAGQWPLLSGSQQSPTYMSRNYNVLWTFADDFAACSEACTHSAEYQAAGGDTWTPVAVSSDAESGYAWAALPVESLPNATTYAFRFTVTDCAEQTTQSSTFYFRTAVTDAAPVLTGGPFVAGGTWPRLATSAAGAFEVSADFQVLWTFSDDYASCAGVCSHIARYRNAADAGWDWIRLSPVSTDPAGTQYAYVTIPVATDDLAPGTYMFETVTWDCLKQTTWSRISYFKVAGCELDSDCSEGEMCSDGQCVEADCSIVWYDGETQLGAVPTQETTRTETAVYEAYVAIYGSNPDMLCQPDLGRPFVNLCSPGEYMCAVLMIGGNGVCLGGSYTSFDKWGYLYGAGTWDVECVPVN